MSGHRDRLPVAEGRIAASPAEGASVAGRASVAERDGAGERAPGALMRQAAEGLGDMLTVLMCSLEQLNRQPMTPRANHLLACADIAACRAGQLLWQALDAGEGAGPAVPPGPASCMEIRP